MFQWLLDLFDSERRVVRRYLKAGAEFGNAVSYIYLGECVGFDSMLSRWENAERDYVNLGYKAIALDDFVEHGGYGVNIDHLVRVPLNGEEPVYHAGLYRVGFLHKIPSAGVIEKVLRTGKPCSGTYTLPSTKNLK